MPKDKMSHPKVPIQSPTSMVIVGATSAIAQAVARIYAERGTRFFLVARQEEKVKVVASDLLSRGATNVHIYVADLRQRDLHADIVAVSQQALGQIDVVLVAQGVYRDQAVSDSDVDIMLDDFMTNALTVLAFTHRYANLLVAQGSGSIVGLSSVAGERGRRSNYAYGAAKAAITAYYSGLRGRLLDTGVHILTVKPGPVDTPMMAGKKIPLVVSVQVVAQDIVKAIDKKRAVLYTPGMWWLIMFIVKLIPERIFSKLKF